MIENCNNPCLSCQNTLYHLKFRGDASCRFNTCPGQCMSLSNMWNSGRNTHLEFFKKDQINICEACFRSNHCHINDCILEKTIIHNAIQKSIQNFPLHYLNPNAAVFKLINKKSDDYFFNMDFIFKNFDKIIHLLTNYERIYSDSIKMKKFYKIILKFISEKNHLQISELNLNLNLDTDEDIFKSWKDISEHLRIYKNYYMGLKSQKIQLNEEKIYLSTDIKNEEQHINNILDFDSKVKFGLQKANNITELYKIKCSDNLEMIKKLVTYVDVVGSTNLESDEKLKILSGKGNYTDVELNNLIFTKKIKVKQKKNETEMNRDVVQSIRVAGKILKLDNSKNEGNLIKINNDLLNVGNNLNNNDNNNNNAILDLNLNLNHNHINGTKEFNNNELTDDIGLFDDDDENEDKIIKSLGKNNENKNENVDGNKNGNKSEHSEEQHLNDISSRIMEPSLGNNNNNNNKVVNKNTKTSDFSKNKNEDKEIASLNSELNKLNNFNKINEPSLLNKGNVDVKKSTDFNSLLNTNNKSNINNLNQNSDISVNSAISTTNPNNFSLENTLPPLNSNLDQTNNSMSNLLVKNTIPTPILLQNGIPIPMPMPIPIPNTTALPIIPPVTHPLPPNFPLPPNLLPDAPPVLTKITAVKITSPNESFNKNIFKPDAKIDTLAKAILGIDPRPPSSNNMPNLIHTNGIHNLHNKLNVGNNSTMNIVSNNNTDSNSYRQENVLPPLPGKENETENKNKNENKNENKNPHHRKEEDNNNDEDEEDLLTGGSAMEDKDYFSMENELDEKTFLQKNSRKYSPEYLDIDLSFLKSNKDIISKNKIRKLSIDEVKTNAKNFMENLQNKMKKYKLKEREDLLKNKDETNFLESSSTSTNSIIGQDDDDNKSINNMNKNSNNLVNLFSDNLRNLDDEFFEIKHNIIMSLMK